MKRLEPIFTVPTKCWEWEEMVFNFASGCTSIYNFPPPTYSKLYQVLANQLLYWKTRDYGSKGCGVDNFPTDPVME